MSYRRHGYADITIFRWLRRCRSFSSLRYYAMIAAATLSICYADTPAITPRLHKQRYCQDAPAADVDYATCFCAMLPLREAEMLITPLPTFTIFAAFDTTIFRRRRCFFRRYLRHAH